MRATSVDNHFALAAPKRAAVALAIALGAIALMSGSASAQTGGATPPPEPAPEPAPTQPAPYSQVFPIAPSVPHTFGQGFGAARKGRGHMGQDIFAACGAPLVSVSWARVVYRGFHRSAGNYVVLRFKKLKQDYFYAHLAAPAMVARNAKVGPGQQVGVVGDTGNAQGCHLHFEIWTGRWYRGGRAVNPLPFLQQWDAYS